MTAIIKSIDEVKNKKIKNSVFTVGFFDIIQAAHIELLEKAAKVGDFLIVGVFSDKKIKSLKGTQLPVYPLIERMGILSTLQMIDIIMEVDKSPEALFDEGFLPDIYVPNWESQQVEKDLSRAANYPKIVNIELENAPRNIIAEVTEKHKK